jgi:Peptidase U49
MPHKVLLVDPREPIDRDVIDRIMFAAAPEKDSAWKALCAKYKPSFHLVRDRKRVTLQARSSNVEFDSKTLGWIWLLGFAAWRAFCLHGPHLFLRWMNRAFLDENMRGTDEAYSEAEAAFESILYVTRDLAQADGLNEADGWPDGVPHRQANKAGFDIEQQAAFDLTMIATAYALLHEVRHVMFNADGERPNRAQEEMACDAFARDFILNDVESYASASKESVDQVLMKRAAGIALGAYIVYEFTPADGRAGDENYPPIADRLYALIARLPPQTESRFWDFAASLLIAILKRRDRAVTVPNGDGRAICVALIEALRKVD